MELWSYNAAAHTRQLTQHQTFPTFPKTSEVANAGGLIDTALLANNLSTSFVQRGKRLNLPVPNKESPAG